MSTKVLLYVVVRSVLKLSTCTGTYGVGWFAIVVFEPELFATQGKSITVAGYNIQHDLTSLT